MFEKLRELVDTHHMAEETDKRRAYAELMTMIDQVEEALQFEGVSVGSTPNGFRVVTRQTATLFVDRSHDPHSLN